MPQSHTVDQPIALFEVILTSNKLCVVYVRKLWRADPNFI